MQKNTSVVLGALVVAVTLLVIVWAAPRRPAPAMPPLAPSVSAPVVASVAPDAALAIESLLAGAPAVRSPMSADGPGTRLLDGTVPPPLGDDAPKALRFGVVLVQYRGAQRAPSTARPKHEALDLAKGLALLAQTDFKASVDKGDPGSTMDLGRIGVGILEPAPNYVLFSLPTGGVGGPVDTPTGYWIIKNLGK
ncbi:MAG: hypothetical protein HY898_37035 [Deltaproteobacteria bacterium]|nr:hypothetical protein [Deltaproteobacteria bacterium]